MNLLLISNSTNPGEEYLGWTQNDIKNFLIKHAVKRVLFIPYAGVTVSWDDYEKKVKNVFNKLGFDLYSIHHESNPIKAVFEAEAIAVGGGNTWQLVDCMHNNGTMRAIRERALAGTPYMGWSAGSNIACPTLKTTNDMPIKEPIQFSCMGLVPFQINPHYLDAHPDGHGGETREQRIEEFIEANRDVFVLGLREASSIVCENNKLSIIGKKPLRVFHYGDKPKEIPANSELDFIKL